jgi:hypothetical protein
MDRRTEGRIVGRLERLPGEDHRAAETRARGMSWWRPSLRIDTSSVRVWIFRDPASVGWGAS